ncbi:MAG: PfkB family carbohydrate kinase [Gaiellaceae bacterium]
MEALAVVGNLSLDRVEGSAPRIGGGPYHAARGLRVLGARAQVVGRCSDEDRPFLLPQLAGLGLPVHLLASERTARFSFSYDGDVRSMRVDAIADPWTVEEARTLDRRVRWVQVAPLARSDFSAETLGELAAGRFLLLDGQGLVRRPVEGPLELDAGFDPALLDHVDVLKLSEEEAEVVGDVDVPELIVTFGSRGSLVRVAGRETRVPAQRLPHDPTGAGDAFAAAYLASRADGLEPVASARRATDVVTALL